MKKNIIIGVISGLLLTILSPFAMNITNGAMGLFSTPRELKATNQRITIDSIVATRQLKDSCFMFRYIIVNQRERINEIEKQLLNINHKLKIK